MNERERSEVIASVDKQLAAAGLALDTEFAEEARRYCVEWLEAQEKLRGSEQPSDRRE